MVPLTPDSLNMCLFFLRVNPALYIHHHQYLTYNASVIGNKREIFQCNESVCTFNVKMIYVAFHSSLDRCSNLTFESSFAFSFEGRKKLLINVDIILTVVPIWFTLINKHNKQLTENNFLNYTICQIRHTTDVHYITLPLHGSLAIHEKLVIFMRIYGSRIT